MRPPFDTDADSIELPQIRYTFDFATKEIHYLYFNQYIGRSNQARENRTHNKLNDISRVRIKVIFISNKNDLCSSKGI